MKRRAATLAAPAIALATAFCCASGVLAAPPAPVGVTPVSSDPPRAPPPPPPPVPDVPSVRWDPRWRQFAVGNYLATGGAIALAFGSLLIQPAPERWTSVNDLDGDVRAALRAADPSHRALARDASDVLLAVALNQLLIDTLLVTWWGHGKPQVAWQMALVDIEALALGSAVNGLVAAITSRERPYREQCVGDAAAELSDCRKNHRYRSFYSGHASTAFTAAGLTCVHHAHLPLYGGGAPDALACGAALVAAGTTGMMRVVADQHFMTDVIAGAALGTLAGTAIPYLLHYRSGHLPAAADGQVKVQLVPAAGGAALVGHF